MPTGDFLYADKLAKTLHNKAAEKCAFLACLSRVLCACPVRLTWNSICCACLTRRIQQAVVRSCVLT